MNNLVLKGFRAVTPDFLAVKVGGSLFSRKDRPKDLDDAAVMRFVKSISPLAQAYPGRVIFITGGGAFGHGAVRDHDAAKVFSLADLTDATFEVKARWAALFRDAGTNAFPLQLAAMCTIRDGIPELKSTVFQDILAQGILPVLAGDALFDEAGKLQVFSSDRVPEVLVPLTKGNLRVVTLTDVDGIIDRGAGGSYILPEIDAWSPQRAYSALWSSSEWDATGGMRTKLDAMVACARGGAECFIMRGEPGMDLDFLTTPFHAWPPHVRSTRISATVPHMRKLR